MNEIVTIKGSSTLQVETKPLNTLRDLKSSPPAQSTVPATSLSKSSRSQSALVSIWLVILIMDTFTFIGGDKTTGDMAQTFIT